MRPFATRWKDIRISTKLYVVVGFMALLILGELLSLRFAMHTLSAARAFVGGEGLWSKAQKNATLSLARYAQSKREEDFQAFLTHLAVPEGDHQARLELLKPSPDLAVVREGFLRGRIDPSDIDPMIELLRRFSWTPYLSRAIAVWTEGDEQLAALKAAGLDLHDAVTRGDGPGAEAALRRVEQLNDRLTALEDEFSFALGSGSRSLERIVLSLLSVAVLIVESIGLTLTFRTSRWISRGLRALTAGAEEIGQGHFHAAPAIPSRDEIGQLAESLGRMGGLLERSYAELDVRVKERTQELANSRDQLSVILRGITDGISVLDAQGNVIFINDEGARLCGMPSAEEFMKAPPGLYLQALDIRGEDGKPFPPEMFPSRLALRGTTDPPEVMIRARARAGGAERWSLVKSAPVLDAARRTRLVVTIFKDFTEHKRAQDALRFLDQSSQILAASLNYRETLRQVMELSVQSLADWCAIDLVNAEGNPEPLAVVHSDPVKTAQALRRREQFPTDWSAGLGAPSVIRSGRSELYADVTDDILRTVARDEIHLAFLREAGIASAMVAPIVARGKTWGAISFVSIESRRRFSLDDLHTAEELARRAGIAIDNATLVEIAQRAVRVRDEFMSIASHELKTPVTALGLQLQTGEKRFKKSLGDQPLPPELKQVFEGSRAQIVRLAKLIDELLDVARISAGRLAFSFETVDLSVVVREVADRFSEQLNKSGSSLTLELQPGVVGSYDPARIEQVIDNLLGNAVKYAAGTPLKVALSRQHGRAVLEVADQGPGIPSDKQTKIFDRFERADADGHVSGLGLGLYIVREIVQGHGGTVRVDSRPGEGARFLVDLPG